jgi:hypothetical protein
MVDFPEADANMIEDSTDLLRLAVVERELLGLIEGWIGFALGVAQLTPTRVASAAEDGVRSATAPYRIASSREVPMLAAPQTLQVLEKIAAGLDFERRTEGRVLTPAWWIHQVVARVTNRLIVENTNSTIRTVGLEVVTRVEAEQSLPIRALIAIRGLELLARMNDHLGLVRTAVAGLKSLRRDPGDDEWLELGEPENEVASMRKSLLVDLAQFVPELATPAFDPSLPDLFGQGYRLLFDAAFRAILAGDDAAFALRLFGGVFPSAFSASARLRTDLADEAQREQIIYGSEPLIDLMELSGCALLMSDVLHDGIWPSVEQIWRQRLQVGRPENFINAFVVAAGYREGLPLLTQGSILRTGRLMMLRDRLYELGVRGRTYARTFVDAEEPPEGQGAIATVFAPEDIPLGESLEDLFVAEFFMQLPEAEGLDFPGGARRLRDRIQSERNARAVGEGDGDGT